MNPVRTRRNGINAISCSVFPKNHPNPVLISIQHEAASVEVGCSDIGEIGPAAKAALPALKAAQEAGDAELSAASEKAIQKIANDRE